MLTHHRNLLRFDKWNAGDERVDTVRYVINGANQIQCIDADGSGACDNGEFEWEYDAYGNLKSDGITQYIYDAANRVETITAGGTTTTYTYNGDGDRIAQEVDDGVSTVTTTYVLDTATPLTIVLSSTRSGPTTAGETTQYWHGLR